MSDALRCRVSVRVVPNGSRNCVAGWSEGVLRVKVMAPALEGKANEMVCGFLAGELGLGKRGVWVERGEKSREKVVVVEGMDLEGVKAKLGVR